MDKLYFRAEVKKQLTLRKWSYNDLSEHTRYTPGTIRMMMCNDEKLSDSAMNEIASVLNISMAELEQAI